MRRVAAAICLVSLAMTGRGLSAQTATSFDGLRIVYSEAGAGDVSLVFVHGWACNRSHWAAQMQYFARQYRVVSLDLIGHGESDAERAEWSIASFGRDIASVIDQLNLRKVVVVGHSANGFSALEAARLRSDRVVAVVGVDGYRNVAAGYFERRYTAQELSAFAAPLRADFKVAMENQVRQFFLPEADPALVSKIARDMAATRPEVAIPAMFAFYHYRNGRQLETLKEVGARIPIISLNAERSRLAVEVWQPYVRRFETLSMSGVGHFLMLERPEEFNALLTKALRSFGL